MGWWGEARPAHSGLNLHRPLGFLPSPGRWLEPGFVRWASPLLAASALHPGAEQRAGAAVPGRPPRLQGEWVDSAFLL